MSKVFYCPSCNANLQTFKIFDRLLVEVCNHDTPIFRQEEDSADTIPNLSRSEEYYSSLENEKVYSSAQTSITIPRAMDLDEFIRTLSVDGHTTMRMVRTELPKANWAGLDNAS